ncbi:MAG: exodeoxyribonuclease VII large subunit [Actinobacteria bacterium]|nr:MAG: exodeoxyribonuclease VII large subunit [Actinomycetota bacterium]
MTTELFPDADRAPRQLSLVRLSGEIARSLAQLGRVTVEGEVHDPRARPGGLVFFTLRDRAAQLAVACPATRARYCRTVAGERVAVTGSVQFNNQRGSVQLVAEEVVPVGEGAVAAATAETRSRLLAEGLLDRPRRALPRLPATIGVVCGADAAVRADIESVVDARFPGYPVEFVEVTVSGPGAAEAITGALGALDARDDVEVIVLARGGGNAAELLPFSDESLCRAVAASRTPVVSSIGHERDRPLCDELADLRFPTPSLAAQAVVPSRSELESELARLRAEGRAAVIAAHERATHRLARVDLRQALTAGAGRAEARLDVALARLRATHPRVRLAGASDRLAALRRELDALSPVRVLERGYAVVRTADGTVVRRASQVSTGDALTVGLAHGRLGTRVEEVDG